jgi:RDD family
MMKPRFEPDSDEEKESWPARTDSERYDAGGWQCAASLDGPLERAKPEFVLEHTETDGSESRLQIDQEADLSNPASRFASPLDSSGLPPVHAVAAPENDADSWRRELSARLSSYRARRRPKPPRYPSLRLKFEANDPPHIRGRTVELNSPIPPTRESAALARAQEDTGQLNESHIELAELSVIRDISNLIEFPRAATVPQRLDELAEPVLDHPRIVEVPETVPPPPALGGILIVPEEEPASERRPGFEIPLQPAPMTRRLMAVTADAILVLLAFALFAYLFLKLAAAGLRLAQTAEMAAALIGMFWIAYQYLLLVHCGTTPGLKLARLELHRFDGRAVPRNIRRWRVLASLLSGLSLAIGYAWCLLDEDQLCWHDRITRTYMAPRNREIQSLTD